MRDLVMFLHQLYGAVAPIASPLNPLGGASDMTVIDQLDGSMKTHPWFVNFGKLTLREGQRVVSIAINGVLQPNVHLPTAGGSGIFNFFWSTGRYEVRSFWPTSEQLAAMNLRQGSNTITFSLVSDIGVQQVTAHVFPWNWNKRVVIVDVDGTVTKSDALGQVLPLLWIDWTQPGVTRLLCAIKANGYEIMYLSARSISMAAITRQFLWNRVGQDRARLPVGPMVLCPDGLVSALHREVGLRAPHHFTISSLQAIRDLFPPNSNPFFAGFGNRNTDDASYREAGIPEEKIFIINPKGVVFVKQGGVQVRETYDTLHNRVNIHFPPQRTVLEEREMIS